MPAKKKIYKILLHKNAQYILFLMPKTSTLRVQDLYLIYFCICPFVSVEGMCLICLHCSSLPNLRERLLDKKETLKVTEK